MPPIRPNVLLIIMDDLTWGDLGCHGNPYTRTPHLDQLHDESTRLTRYCSGPVCTPARAALMTGRYPYRTRAIDTYLGRSCMDPDERALAAQFQAAGYRTCISGKWHLGDCHPMRAMDMGFEEALVHNGGGLVQPANLGRDDYFDPELMHNGKLTPCEGYCTDIFADHAMRFIDDHRDEPWFCYFATNAPHSPMQVAEAWARPHLDAGLPEAWARLYGMVDNIDHNVGRLLQKLRALDLDDDTIVIYTSDHGPCGSARVDGESRFNAGLRDIKGTVYQGGVQVPCFWRYPGRLRPGRDVRYTANPVDVMPTLADACGFTPPTDRAIDGIDLWPLLIGDAASEAMPDRNVYLQWHRGDEPVRFRNAAAIGRRYKWLRRREDEPDELYDLDADPDESEDLAAAEPERVETMRAAYEAWFDDVSATRPDNYAPPRIVLGTAQENPVTLTRQDWRLYPASPEAWNTETPGYWPVHLPEPGRYRIRIALPTVPAPAELTFRCGDLERTSPLAASWTPRPPIWLYDQPLPAGDHDLEAYFTLHERGQRLGVWNVELRRIG